jgi:stage V sporulation protein B
LLIIVGMVSSVILARVLGPSGRGQWAQILLTATLVFRLLVMGIPTAQIYTVNKLNNDRQKVFGNVLVLIIIMSLIGTSLYFFGIKYLHEIFFSNTDYKLFSIVSIMIPVEIALLTFFYVFLIDRNFKAFNILQLIKPILFSILLVIAAVFNLVNILSVLQVFLLTSVIVLLITSIALWRDKLRFIFSFNIKTIKQLLNYGLKSHLGQIFIILNERIDLWLISYFLSVSQVGIYAVALIATKFVNIPDAIGVNLFSVITKTKEHQAGILAQRVLRISISFSILLILFFMILSYPMINIFYGADFLKAIIPFIILLPLVFTNSVAKICRAYLSGNGYPLIPSLASGLSLIISVILGIILIKEWGIIGAATMATTSSVVYASVMYGFFIKKSKLGLIKSLVIQKEDIIILLDKGKSLWIKFAS